MHHALEVAEILSAIASNLRSEWFGPHDEEIDYLRQHPQKELLRFALACRTFASAALPLIWSSIHYKHLPYLAMSMRAGQWKFLRSRESEWQRRTKTIELISTNYESDTQWLTPRFEFYASCIRGIDFSFQSPRDLTADPSRCFSLGATVLQAWTRFAEHQRLFPALTCLSHWTTHHDQGLLKFFDTLRETHAIRCLIVDTNNSSDWLGKRANVESTFLADLAAGRCGRFESLEIREPQEDSPNDLFFCLPIRANTRRLVLIPWISQALFQTISKALSELRYFRVHHPPIQDTTPITLPLSSFSHLTHLAYKAPTIHSLKAVLRDLPAPQLIELVCEITDYSNITMEDVLSIHTILPRWKSSLVVFGLSDYARDQAGHLYLSLNGTKLVQLITSFRYLKALRSLSLGFMKYIRAKTLEQDEENGREIVSAYGDAVEEIGFSENMLLPPPVFVPILTSGRFSRCCFGLMTETESDLNYLIEAAENVPSEFLPPRLNDTWIQLLTKRGLAFVRGQVVQQHDLDNRMEVHEKVKKALSTMCWQRPEFVSR